MLFALHIIQAFYKNAQLSLLSARERFDLGDVIRVADYACDVPFGEKEWCHEQRDLAVAAEEEDVFRHDCRGLYVELEMRECREVAVGNDGFGLYLIL